MMTSNPTLLNDDHDQATLTFLLFSFLFTYAGSIILLNLCIRQNRNDNSSQDDIELGNNSPEHTEISHTTNCESQPDNTLPISQTPPTAAKRKIEMKRSPRDELFEIEDGRKIGGDDGTIQRKDLHRLVLQGISPVVSGDETPETSPRLSNSSRKVRKKSHSPKNRAHSHTDPTRQTVSSKARTPRSQMEFFSPRKHHRSSTPRNQFGMKSPT